VATASAAGNLFRAGTGSCEAGATASASVVSFALTMPASSGAASAGADALRIGWGLNVAGAETWSEQTAGAEAWSQAAAGSETWSEQAAGAETWTDAANGNETWAEAA